MFVVAKSDVGKTRQENQDKFCIKVIDDETVAAVVCDGMGGAQSGGYASELAANAGFDRLLLYYRNNADDNSIRNTLITSLTAANTLVYEESKKDEAKKGMGTTCIGAIIRKDKAYISSVGDSRAYLLDENGITQITNDHTIVEILYEQGKIEKDDKSNHEMSHIITKAIGTEPDLEPDYFEVELEKNSIILICSDGLTNYCSDELIYSYVYSKDLERSLDDLINYANDKGGKDNITVAIIKN